MGYYFIQKLKPDWKDVFTPLAEDMKVLLTPSKIVKPLRKPGQKFHTVLIFCTNIYITLNKTLPCVNY